MIAGKLFGAVYLNSSSMTWWIQWKYPILLTVKFREYSEQRSGVIHPQNWNDLCCMSDESWPGGHNWLHRSRIAVLYRDSLAGTPTIMNKAFQRSSNTPSPRGMHEHPLVMLELAYLSVANLRPHVCRTHWIICFLTDHILYQLYLECRTLWMSTWLIRIHFVPKLVVFGFFWPQERQKRIKNLIQYILSTYRADVELRLQRCKGWTITQSTQVLFNTPCMMTDGTPSKFLLMKDWHFSSPLWQCISCGSGLTVAVLRDRTERTMFWWIQVKREKWKQDVVYNRPFCLI